MTNSTHPTDTIQGNNKDEIVDFVLGSYEYGTVYSELISEHKFIKIGGIVKLHDKYKMKSFRVISKGEKNRWHIEKLDHPHNVPEIKKGDVFAAFDNNGNQVFIYAGSPC